jgi:hypothetical protein
MKAYFFLIIIFHIHRFSHSPFLTNGIAAAKLEGLKMPCFGNFTDKGVGNFTDRAAGNSPPLDGVGGGSAALILIIV